jgi:hypothetical protein
MEPGAGSAERGQTGKCIYEYKRDPRLTKNRFEKFDSRELSYFA